MALIRRPGARWFSGRVNYAFSYIKAAGFAGGSLTPYPDKTTYNYAAGDRQLPLDDRSAFNTIERNVNGGDNALTQGYDRSHQFNASLVGSLPYQVSLSLIQRIESGFAYPLTQTSDDPRARETDRAPVNATTDMRLTRRFPLSGWKGGVFVEVTNLLDRKNILAFDNSTIPSQVQWEEDQDPAGELKRAFSCASIPLYGPPRQIGLGVTLDF